MIEVKERKIVRECIYRTKKGKNEAMSLDGGMGSPYSSAQSHIKSVVADNKMECCLAGREEKTLW